MRYVKMYFTGKEEIFEYDSFGVEGYPIETKVFPFLESLLLFQELDCEEVVPVLERVNDNWEKWCIAEDRDAAAAVLTDLGRLKARHIYFQLLYTRCYNSISGPDQNAEKQQLQAELREAAQLPQYQRQIRSFFERILDVDQAGRDPKEQAWRSYDRNGSGEPDLFQFRPIPLGFEPVEEGVLASVLYSADIHDIINYSLRTCVERGITVRRCKNCGRWFAQTGRVTAEYCERPVPKWEQLCREIGPFKQWSRKQSEDPIFKAYRKEYKKRFAWIKAGRVTDAEFYEWSEDARAEKKRCDQGEITLEEFQQWLRRS